MNVIIENIDNDWDFPLLQESTEITVKFMMKHYDKNWDWGPHIFNPIITFGFIKKCGKNWNVWHYTNKNVASLNFWQRSHESILVLWKNNKIFNFIFFFILFFISVIFITSIWF
mgnify:CR=1 FL=1